MKGAKKVSARGSICKGKKNPKKKPKQGSKRATANSNDNKGVDKDLHKTKSRELCKFNLELNQAACQPLADFVSCRGSVTCFDKTVSSIVLGLIGQSNFLYSQQ